MQGEGGGNFAMHWYAIRGEVLITNAAIHFMRWKPGWARAGLGLDERATWLEHTPYPLTFNSSSKELII